MTGMQQLVEVDQRHVFDIDRLSEYLNDKISGLGKLTVRQFHGGQSNPTYLLDDGKRQLVLRRKPPGQLLPSAHAVDREYRIMSALQKTDVPVPRTYVYCDDPEVIGTPFFVMDYLRGRTFWDPALPGLSVGERAAIFDDMNRVIAALHSVDYQAIGLGDYGRPGNYLARQVDRWTRQYRASETRPIEAMEHLIAWLPHHIPEGDETCIVHGDFRLDNLIIHSQEPRVIGVLDWELSTLGHPLADFAYHMMAWNVPADVFRGMAGVNFQALGIPEEAEYVRRYCERTGRAGIPNWDFYLAFNLFRMAAILQGVYARALQGNASSSNGLEQGAKAVPLAEIGWQFAQRSDARQAPVA
jgi:aminoglycoside phosphotransferase (APT) family kinase protein